MPHIIWDWNGTLLDDLDVVVAAVSDTIVEFGADPIDADDYRRHYVRPVHRFYEALFKRPITTAEWERLDRRFHDVYRARLGHARLAVDARRAIECAASLGASQSLLSMFIHDDLLQLVDDHGIAEFFVRIDGLRGAAGVTKHLSMQEHVAALLAHPAAPDGPGEFTVIGDALDDAAAAAANGLSCVLYDSGSHERRDLESAGVPVAGSLMDALGLSRLVC